MLSLPNVDWSDLVDAKAAGVDLPHLDRLFAGSAVGAMVTNGVAPAQQRRQQLRVAGCRRALRRPADRPRGQGFDGRRARSAATRAGVVFQTRTGTPPGRRPRLHADRVGRRGRTRASSTAPRWGSSATSWRGAGIDRAVIANGDGSDPSTPEERVPPYRRSAVAALMTPDGPRARRRGRPATCSAATRRRRSVCGSTGDR